MTTIGSNRLDRPGAPASQAFLAALVESADDAIFAKDLDGNIATWNPAAQRLYGYSPDEIVGRPVAVLEEKERKGETARLLERVKGGECITSFDTVRRRRDGTPVAVSVTVSPIRAADGGVVGASVIARDIGERQRTEARLRHSEAMLREAQRIAHVGNWDLDLVHDVLTWSPEIFRIFEIDPDRFAASYEAFLAAVHPDDRDLVHDAYRRSVAERRPYEVVHRLRMADGRVKFVRERGETSYGPSWEPLRSIGTVQDITDQVRAEEESRTASRYARSLIEASLDPLVTIARDGRITDVNTATELATGRPRAALIGSDFSDYFTDPERARSGYRTVFAQGTVRDYALTIRHASGSTMDVLYNATVYRNQAGEVQGVFAAARDVTERRRAQAAVEAERQRFEAVFETLPVYIVILTPDYHVPFANRFFRERFGESRGRRCYEYLFGLEQPCAICESFTPFRTKAPHAWEWRGPDGRDYSIFDYPFTDTDGSPLILEMGIDVTDQKRAEKDIRTLNAELEGRVEERTAALAEANRELEAFAYSVSHDLRAPLRALDGFSQAVLDDYRSRLDTPGQEYLKRIRAASQRMGRLIDDMLRLSRVTRAEMRRERVDLGAMATDILATLRQAEPGREAVTEVAPGLVAEGDPALLHAMLENLLDNAWKFTARAPTTRIAVTAEQRDGETVFQVRDNGVGFDMAYADKLFGAFQRLHAAEDFPGTGVGLATCHRIVRRHGGRLWAEAQPDAGATFYFTLR